MKQAVQEHSGGDFMDFRSSRTRNQSWTQSRNTGGSMDSLTDGGALTDTDSPLTPVEVGSMMVTEREAAPEENWGEEVFVQAVVDVDEDDDDFQEFDEAAGPASEAEAEVEGANGDEDVQEFEEAVLAAEAVPGTVAEAEGVSDTDVGTDDDDEFQGFEEAPVSTVESVEPELVSVSESESEDTSIELSSVPEPEAVQVPTCDKLAMEPTVEPSDKEFADEPAQDDPEPAQGAGSASDDEPVREPTEEEPHEEAPSEEPEKEPSDGPTSEHVEDEGASDSPGDEPTEEPEEEPTSEPIVDRSTSDKPVVDRYTSDEPDDEPTDEPEEEPVDDEPVADGGDQKDDDDDDWGDDDFQDFETAVPSTETSAEVQAGAQMVSTAEAVTANEGEEEEEEEEDNDWGDDAFQEFEEAEGSAPATPVAVPAAVSSPVPAPTAAAAVSTCTFHPGMWAFTTEAVNRSTDYAADRDALLALLQRTDQLDPTTVASVGVMYPQLRAMSGMLFGDAAACIFAADPPSEMRDEDKGDGGEGEATPSAALPLPVSQRGALGNPDFTAWARRLLLDAILDTVPSDAAPPRNDRESPMPHRRRRRYSSGEAFDVGKSLDDDPAVLSKTAMSISTASAAAAATAATALSSPVTSPRHRSPAVSLLVTPTLARVSEAVESRAPSQQSPEPLSESEPVPEPDPVYSINMGLDFLASMSSSSASSKPSASADDDPLSMFFGGSARAPAPAPALSAQIPKLFSPLKSFDSPAVRTAAACSTAVVGSAAPTPSAPLSSKADAFLNGLPDFSYLLSDSKS